MGLLSTLGFGRRSSSNRGIETPQQREQMLKEGDQRTSNYVRSVEGYEKMLKEYDRMLPGYNQLKKQAQGGDKRAYNQLSSQKNILRTQYNQMERQFKSLRSQRKEILNVIGKSPLAHKTYKGRLRQPKRPTKIS